MAQLHRGELGNSRWQQRAVHQDARRFGFQWPVQSQEPSNATPRYLTVPFILHVPLHRHITLLAHLGQGAADQGMVRTLDRAKIADRQWACVDKIPKRAPFHDG